MEGVRRGVLTLVVVLFLLGGCGEKTQVTAAPPAPTPPTAIEPPSPKPALPPTPAPAVPPHERPGRDRPAGGPAVIEGPALGSSVIRVPSTMKQGREVIAQMIVSPTDLATLRRQDAVTRGEADVRDT